MEVEMKNKNLRYILSGLIVVALVLSGIFLWPVPQMQQAAKDARSAEIVDPMVDALENPSELPAGYWVTLVSGTENRACARMDSTVVGGNFPDEPVEVTGKAFEGADEILWLRVTDPAGTEGWIPASVARNSNGVIPTQEELGMRFSFDFASGKCSESDFEAVVPVVTEAPIATEAPAATEEAPTLEPTTLPTATFAPNWKFAIPGAPNTLPVELSEDIQYVEPPVDCAQANDANQTCSTIKGQVTDADFTLAANTGLRMTGDKIVISQDGTPLAGFYNTDTKQTMWIVVNASGVDISLHMTAKYGSYRGFFTANWDVPKIENMLGLGLYQYIASNNPLPTPEPFGPTPVWNCESSIACEHSNVNVVVWTGSEWIKIIGFYAEGKTPSWNQK